MLRPTALAAALLIASAGHALAQGRPADKQPETPAAAPAQWPAIVKKNLYATNDLRGKKAPEFVVEKVLTDKPDREGKVVLVDFWATWCGPCRALIPELNEFQEKFKDDLVVIGVSDEPEGKVRGFLRNTKVTYTQAVDTKARMKKALGVKGIPHVMIISTDGIVRWQGFPGSAEDPLTEDVIRQIIAADPGVQKRKQSGKPEAKKPEAKKPAPKTNKPAEKQPAEKPDAKPASGN